MKGAKFLEHIAEGFAVILGAWLGLYITNQLIILGYHAAMNDIFQLRSNQVNPDVKKRTQREGNIFKYPFRNEVRQAAPPSDSDSPTESAQVKEEITEGGTDGAA